MAFGRIELPISFFFAPVRVFSDPIFFLLRNRLLGASGEPFFILFAPKAVF